MSQHFPVLSAAEVVRVLRRQGFLLAGQKGNHQSRSKAETGKAKGRHPGRHQVIVPWHGSKPIPIGTLKSIIEGSGLSVDDFR